MGDLPVKVGKRTAKLLREAMVLAFVEGSRWGQYHGKSRADDDFPADLAIVRRVLEASVMFADLYPALSRTDDAQAADDARRERALEFLRTMVSNSPGAGLNIMEDAMSGVIKLRKKPVVIEGIQWTGDNFGAVQAFCPLARQSDDYEVSRDLVVVTLEDKGSGSAQVPHVVTLYDTILKGTSGEFYPIKPEILRATYDVVEQ